MAFVASTTGATVLGTMAIPVPKVIDLSGNGFTKAAYTHMQVVNTVAAGQLNLQTDASPNVVIAMGINSAIMPLPPGANTITVSSAGGGSGVLLFGRHY